MQGLQPGPTFGAFGSWLPGWWLRAAGGSVVSLMCDAGDRYAGSYNDAGWLAAHGLDPPAPHEAVLENFHSTGVWTG